MATIGIGALSGAVAELQVAEAARDPSVIIQGARFPCLGFQALWFSDPVGQEPPQREVKHRGVAYVPEEVGAEGDHLAGLNLGVNTYEKIGKMIRELHKPVFSVLEGGYSEKMPECVLSYIKGLR